jgi:hypothetical protein
MTQTTFPEIQTATEALQSRIAITESEMAEMKASIAAKRQLVRSLRKALAAFAPQKGSRKKRAVSQQAA